ncbi:MAG: pyridoxamine 5'-phosphate oxidase [Betaproteobacteria bacterium]|nr:MAG: pyridoxamine 5'-phosphate oxidase [Betaproteobacteria bacterium]
MTRAALRARVLEYLRAHHVMTLATHGREGPWATAVFYVNAGFTLYFLSAPKSRHSTNLVSQPRIAATIQEDYADWPRIKGVQLEGLAGEISGDEERHARKLYGDKFPIVGKLAQAPASIVAALAKVRWYRLVPERLYFIDNSRGFGHRDELIPRGAADSDQTSR